VRKAAAKSGKSGGVMSDDERMRLVSTEQSLGMEPEPKMPSSISGLETFTLIGPGDEDDEDGKGKLVDADSLFNLPETPEEDDKND